MKKGCFKPFLMPALMPPLCDNDDIETHISTQFRYQYKETTMFTNHFHSNIYQSGSPAGGGDGNPGDKS
jgi:hypothetical protein